MLKQKRTTKKKCPECGKDMLIRYTGHEREWRCKDYYGFRSTCFGRSPISTRTVLTKEVIAEDLARESIINRSSDQQKKQTNFRRLAGGIGRVSHENEYLSESERTALLKASSILDRLGGAAELAKEILKRKEEESEIRRKTEEREMYLSLAKSFLKGISGHSILLECEMLCDYLDSKKESSHGMRYEIKILKTQTTKKNFSKLFLLLGETIYKEFENSISHASFDEFASFKKEAEKLRQHDEAIGKYDNVVKLSRAR